ncbi:Leucine-rich repeat (LRR) family protein [Abeliophyllum distichum]|uniref:Leucine-rich repeat (LRR) family protein n=1 Tax=Abeliophyllum distichum TaxID=126358 RepID=A0ABD1P8N6_9LAMI
MSASIFLLWLVSIPFMIHATAQPRGYLLNCGANDDVEEGPLKYVTDDDFITTGKKTNIKKPDTLAILQTLRFFPNAGAKKYCYSIPVVKGGKHLVKTMYYYGGFDGGEEPPVFDQIIDGTKWSIVNTTEDYAMGLSSYYEVVVMAQNRYLSICLARNEHTVSSPFISALEVHSLDDSVYNSTDFKKYALVTIARHSFGSDGHIISFPDDNFNRYWHPFADNNPFVSSHSNVTSSSFWDIPPQKVFATALTTSRGKTLAVKWPPFFLPSRRYYITLYFQDTRTLSPYSWRVFDVHVNNETFYSNLNVTTDGVTVYGTEWPLTGHTEISLIPRNDMPVGPLINAGEIFQILALGGRTVTRDVVAMEDLKKSFNNRPEDWAGDPCLPRENPWTGVTCSIGQSIRIVSLNLTGSGLSGSLPKRISKLTALKHLWLGDNKLSGTIPDMSGMKALETLHLENNKLEGSVPKSLGELPNLREVFLQNNKFNGSTPTSLTKKDGINLKLSSVNHLSEE